MGHALLEQFAAAAADSLAAARQAIGRGRPLVRTLGVDAPVELIRAAGAQPVRIVARPGTATPIADRILGNASMGVRGKRLFEELLSNPAPVIITHADAVQPQLFAALRELARIGEAVPQQVHFLDLLHLPRQSSKAYNDKRMEKLADWLAGVTGHRASEADLASEIERAAGHAELIRRVGALRSAAKPKLSGSDMLDIVASSCALERQAHVDLLDQLLLSSGGFKELDGERLFLAGSAHEGSVLYRAIEAAGAIIVGEDHEWGEDYRTAIAAAPSELSDPLFRPVARIVDPASRAARVAAEARRCGARAIVCLAIGDDEAAPWDFAAIARGTDLPVIKLAADPDDPQSLQDDVERFLSRSRPELSEAATVPRTEPRRSKAAQREGQRSRKSLQSLASFGAYQREWFSQVRLQVAAGSPFAVVNANAPQEILRAMGIPFVVNQWWASIVAAKQQSRRYAALLKDHDYPTKVEAYSSQGLAAAFDGDPELAPWGGLPTPDFVHAVASSDPTVKIFDEWAEVTSARPFIYERTIDPRWEISSTWWEDLPEGWADALEAERLDLMVEELRTVIAELEQSTGRTFSMPRFREVMDLVNEQEDYYRRTRDLIARTTPAPIGIVDSMPATMVPQWHRGTEWARDAAKSFYEEVQSRVDDGLAAAQNERIRLMWVGRGLWSDMGFYQKWEESHGAVFVWSMYLALAADGYIRRIAPGQDPMRALAARFITMGDELRMPSWAGPWHVHEAKTHAVDGAVALRDADPFVVRALRTAGVPVLELPVDNFSREGEDAGQIERLITQFIEGPAQQQSEERHAAA